MSEELRASENRVSLALDELRSGLLFEVVQGALQHLVRAVERRLAEICQHVLVALEELPHYVDAQENGEYAGGSLAGVAQHIARGLEHREAPFGERGHLRLHL